MKSPNYPLNYTVDHRIETPLKVAEGKAIQLTFTSFDIEECYDPEWGHCPCDYVQVFDSDMSELLKECGNEPPSPITSTSNYMVVIFNSDYSENRKGFSADWKEVDPAPAATFGEEMSPNYPENYPDNLDRKEYVIKAAIGKKVELTIEDLALEYCDQYCDCDKLEIYDTPPTGARTLLAVSILCTIYKRINRVENPLFTTGQLNSAFDKLIIITICRRFAETLNQAAPTRAAATS